MIAAAAAQMVRWVGWRRGAPRHWSIPDPVPPGDPDSFDAALAQLADRVERLAPRLAAVS
jgi:hypothetical protein